MSVIILLIIISLLIAIGFLISFIWSVNNGQIDDDYTPSVRILFDTKPSEEKIEKNDSPKITSENNVN